jgi:hypothetical protein
MAFFPELMKRSADELVEGFRTGPRPEDRVPEEEEPFWLEEAAIGIARSGERGLDCLLQEVPGADEPRLLAILLALSFVPQGALEQGRGRIRDALVSFIRDPRPLVAANAIDTLRCLNYAEVGQDLLPLLRDKSPYVVGSVLRYLRRHDPGVAGPILLDALDSPEPIIRQNAIDELDDLNSVEALPRIRRLLNDADDNVRQAAQSAVRNLEQLQSQTG